MHSISREQHVAFGRAPVLRAGFPLPSMTTVMIWHKRTDIDPGARAFRALVADAVAGAYRAG